MFFFESYSWVTDELEMFCVLIINFSYLVKVGVMPTKLKLCCQELLNRVMSRTRATPAQRDTQRNLQTINQRLTWKIDIYFKTPTEDKENPSSVSAFIARLWDFLWATHTYRLQGAENNFLLTALVPHPPHTTQILLQASCFFSAILVSWKPSLSAEGCKQLYNTVKSLQSSLSERKQHRSRALKHCWLSKQWKLTVNN